VTELILLIATKNQNKFYFEINIIQKLWVILLIYFKILENGDYKIWVTKFSNI